MPQENQVHQDVLAAALGAFCALMLAISPWQIDLDVPYPFYKGPLLMPLLILTMGTLASLPSWRRLLMNRKSRSFHVSVPRKALCMFVVVALFPVCIKFAGLELATIVILSAELFLAGQRNIKIIAIVTACVTILFWIVFRQLLDVYFPEPLILSLFGA